MIFLITSIIFRMIKHDRSFAYGTATDPFGDDHTRIAHFCLTPGNWLFDCLWCVCGENLFQACSLQRASPK
jgi:hypothetical protein